MRGGRTGRSGGAPETKIGSRANRRIDRPRQHAFEGGRRIGSHERTRSNPRARLRLGTRTGRLLPGDDPRHRPRPRRRRLGEEPLGRSRRGRLRGPPRRRGGDGRVVPRGESDGDRRGRRRYLRGTGRRDRVSHRALTGGTRQPRDNISETAKSFKRGSGDVFPCASGPTRGDSASQNCSSRS